MVKVTMGHQQHIHLTQILKRFELDRSKWIGFQPRVGDEDLTLGGRDFERRLSQPLNFDLRRLSVSYK